MHGAGLRGHVRFCGHAQSTGTARPRSRRHRRRPVATIVQIVITNTSAGTEPLGSVNIAPRLGVNSMGTNVKEHDREETWTATVFGRASSPIKLRAADLASTLAPGQQITASGSARISPAPRRGRRLLRRSISRGMLRTAGQEPAVTIMPGPLSTFSLSTSPTTVAAGGARDVTITARTRGNSARDNRIYDSGYVKKKPQLLLTVNAGAVDCRTSRCSTSRRRITSVLCGGASASRRAR